MKKIVLLLFFCNTLSSWQYHSPREIQETLDEAETQFSRALEIFNPWYTGPILTPSATMMPPGMGNIQAYVFANDIYASFNAERKSVSLEHNLINLNPIMLIQTGITDSLDGMVTVQTNTNWQNGHVGGGYGDTQVTLGFLIQPQTLYVPKVKFSVQETLPTGHYKNLHADRLNSTGAGSYQTQFSLAAGKLMFWTTQHPINARIALAYKIPTTVALRGYNTYGGGIGTKGAIRPGKTFSADFGIEVSLTQRWVFASDVVYTTTSQSTFHGSSGMNGSGSPASLGSGYSDQLSLAPAIEYNWSGNLGILAGVQFTVYGRNSSNFVSGIFSVEWTFP